MNDPLDTPMPSSPLGIGWGFLYGYQGIPALTFLPDLRRCGDDQGVPGLEPDRTRKGIVKPNSTKGKTGAQEVQKTDSSDAGWADQSKMDGQEFLLFLYPDFDSDKT